MLNSNISIILNNKDSLYPKRSTEFSAGYDIFSSEEICIPPDNFHMLKLPFSFSFKNVVRDNYEIIIVPRSSYGIKKRLRLFDENGVAKYIKIEKENDNIYINLLNDSNTEIIIPKNEHFLQFVIINKDDKLNSIFFEPVISSSNINKEYSFDVYDENFTYTLVNRSEFSISSNDQITFPIGFKAKFSEGTWMGANISKEFHSKIIISNATPVIDADYYGNTENEGLIFVSLKNVTDEKIILEESCSIIEFWCKPFYTIDDEIKTQKQRKGGIGSTT